MTIETRFLPGARRSKSLWLSRALGAALVLLATAEVIAAQHPPQEIQSWGEVARTMPERLPVKTLDIYDPTNVLTPNENVRILRQLQQFLEATTHTLAVAIADDLHGEPIEDFSMRLAEAWRVGDSKRDDGIIISFERARRLARIDVGYGLEGVLPDVVAQRLLRHTFRRTSAPFPSASDVSALITKLQAHLQAHEPDQKPSGTQDAPEVTGVFDTLIFFTVVAGLVGAAFWLVVSRRPNMGSYRRPGRLQIRNIVDGFLTVLSILLQSGGGRRRGDSQDGQQGGKGGRFGGGGASGGF